MTRLAIDAYLDELLDLTVDAVAPAPVAASALLSAGPVIEAVVATVEAKPAETVAVEIPPGLLAELDADPLFAEPADATADAAAPHVAAIPVGLLDELDSDPLFAAPLPAPEPVIIADDLLAELDSDPLFGAAVAPSIEPLAIDIDLLAELESDPLFAAQMQETPAPVATPAPVSRERAPTPAATRTAPATHRTGLRPVELTPPALPPSVTTTHRWLRVAVGEDSYAVELLRVQEVGRTVPIVAMRGAAPSVLGAMNLRGRIVPVFDLGLWLGTGRVTPDERARIVVVERDNELIGALVSAVDDVVTLGPDRIEPPLMAAPSRAIVGVARVVAKPTVLLDANALFG